MGCSVHRCNYKRFECSESSSRSLNARRRVREGSRVVIYYVHEGKKSLHSLRYPFQNWFPHKSNLMPWWFVIGSRLFWVRRHFRNWTSTLFGMFAVLMYLSNQLCFYHFDASPRFTGNFLLFLVLQAVSSIPYLTSIQLWLNEKIVFFGFFSSRLHGSVLTHRQSLPSRRMWSQRIIVWLLSMQKNEPGYWESGNIQPNMFLFTAWQCALTYIFFTAGSNRDIKESDKGWYMCQINTDPMKSQIAYLDVVGKYVLSD